MSKCESIDHITKIENFHIVLKLLRITSWCLGFINNLKSKISKKGVNKHNYIDTAELPKPKFLWLKVNHMGKRDYISQEQSKDLENSLFLKIDENGLYRSTSRSNRAKLLPYSVEHPIILNRKHFLINLIVLDAYERIKYNERQTLAELREEFWMPTGKSFMKQVSRSCMICRKFNASPYSYPKIPDLPPERLDDQPSFSGVGIDYTGFLFCKNVFLMTV